MRFEPEVAARLSAWASAHPGLSLSSAANRLVDEALRMQEHPGIVFRPGASGRRAGVAAGPDVWEVVRSVRSARLAEPDLTEPQILHLVADNTGLSPHAINVAVGYWSSYPEEIDAELLADEAATELAESAWLRRETLLRRP